MTEKKMMGFRVSADIAKLIEADSERAKISTARMISRIVKEHYFPKSHNVETQKPLRAGEAIDCPIFILPIEPRGAWVDVSVCETCNKEEKHGRPCRSWQTYQSDLRLEREGILKPKTKKQGDK